jgi:hypothetical protein
LLSGRSGTATGFEATPAAMEGVAKSQKAIVPQAKNLRQNQKKSDLWSNGNHTENEGIMSTQKWEPSGEYMA